MTNVGLQRLVGGCVFPIGLMMIVLVGGMIFVGLVLYMIHAKSLKEK